MVPAFPFAGRPPDDTESQLREALLGCARRSVPALHRIHDLIAPQLLATLLQMLGDRRRADAALVDCFVRIWEEAGSFNPQRSQPRAWLLSMARHCAMDLMRELPAEAPDEVDSALSFLHVALHYEGVATEQRLLQLAWRSGRSPAQIARALQLPLRQVQREIRSALAALGASPA